MPKIRDLGINVIPATMRPPEIGMGGFPMSETCNPTCPDNTAQCEPNSGCAAPSARYMAGGFTDDAVVQLKQQLRNSIK
jgi:hypothetical protein